MKHGSLLKGSKPNGSPEEVILILPMAQAQMLVEIAEAAAKAHPRKTTWVRFAKELQALECW